MMLAANATASPSTAGDATTINGPYMFSKFDYLQVFLTASAALLCILSASMVAYSRYNRRLTLQGHATAASFILLPSFEPVLWLVGAVGGAFAVFYGTAFAVDFYPTRYPPVLLEIFYSGRQFTLLLVVVFILQAPETAHALRRAVLTTLVLATYTVPIAWYMVAYGDMDDMHAVNTAARALLPLVFVYAAIRAPACAGTGPMREYCAFVLVYYALHFANGEMFQSGQHDVAFTLSFVTLMWGSLAPLLHFRLLRAESVHWRAMGQRACELQSHFRLHHGLPDKHTSSMGMHTVTQMRRSLIIDFALLERQHPIAIGTNSVIFRGLLGAELAVAIKTYSLAQYDEDTVAEFAHVAAVCGALRHPNVVQFHGMCISPPTASLVTELCHATLRETLATSGHRNDELQARAKCLLDVAHMLDVARAVAYLHSFLPPYPHRDIHPDNFLMDLDGNVKLMHFTGPVIEPQADHADSTEMTPLEDRYSGVQTPRAFSVDFRPSNAVNRANGPGYKAKPVRETIEYVAPEYLSGERMERAGQSEAADVYSLAITLWDILHPGHVKASIQMADEPSFFDNVTNGDRPTLAEWVHPGLRALIEKAWQTDAAQRPSAMEIVHRLESVQVELHMAFAEELDALSVRTTTTNGSKDCLTGAEVIALLVDRERVSSVAEAVRLGNALMDTGLLHHVQHARGFEDSTAIYYFDDDSALPRMSSHKVHKSAFKDRDDGDDASVASKTASEVVPRAHSLYMNRVSSQLSLHRLLDGCACRQLGQRWIQPVSASRGASQWKKSMTGIGTDEAARKTLTASLLGSETQDAIVDFDNAHVALDIKAGN